MASAIQVVATVEAPMAKALESVLAEFALVRQSLVVGARLDQKWWPQETLIVIPKYPDVLAPRIDYRYFMH